jgi:outer membrane lipoprotein-sorting protein
MAPKNFLKPLLSYKQKAMSKTRLATLVAALCLPLFLAGAGQPAPPRLIEFSAEQQAELSKVNAYLNAIHTLKSNFVQLGPEGQLVQGVLFIEKPGRMRFEYQPPSPLLIVATGGRLYVRNAKLNTVSNYSLSASPLGILLDDQVNLMRNSAILGVEQSGDSLTVRARTSDNRSQSNIALVFSWPNVELRQWIVKDNQGGLTTVALTGVQSGIALDESLFAVPTKAPPKFP